MASLSFSPLAQSSYCYYASHRFYGYQREREKPAWEGSLSLPVLVIHIICIHIASSSSGAAARAYGRQILHAETHDHHHPSYTLPFSPSHILTKTHIHMHHSMHQSLMILSRIVSCFPGLPGSPSPALLSLSTSSSPVLAGITVAVYAINTHFLQDNHQWL